jgi:hypothetical protein
MVTPSVSLAMFVRIVMLGAIVYLVLTLYGVHNPIFLLSQSLLVILKSSLYLFSLCF